MATFTWTFCTIEKVLQLGGEVEFGKLAELLASEVPERFRDIKNVERAITNYTACLKYENGIVRFDRKAISYAKFGIMERDVQFALHTSLPNMEEWQLYPLIIRTNSKKCPAGIPWEEIPRSQYFDEERFPYDSGCDFRANQHDGCTAHCRVSKDIFKKYRLVE